VSWWFNTAAEGAQLQAGQFGVSHVAANLTFAGGAAHFTVTRKHTAPNLALASGTFAATKFVPVHSDAPNMQLTGGSQHFTVTRKHTAGNLSLSGGTDTLTINRRTAHAAAHLTLAGGTHAIGRSFHTTSSAAHLSLVGGTHTTTATGAPPALVKVYTTDETPETLVGATSRREPLRLSRRKW